MACHKPCNFKLGKKAAWKFILGQEWFKAQNQSWINLAHSGLNNSKKRNGSKSKNENAGETKLNSFTNAGTSGWSALISWRHHRELRWTPLYGLPVSLCRLKALWNRVWLTHNRTLAGTTRKANPINRPEVNSSNKTYRLKIQRIQTSGGVLGLAPAIRKGGFLA